MLVRYVELRLYQLESFRQIVGEPVTVPCITEGYRYVISTTGPSFRVKSQPQKRARILYHLLSSNLNIKSFASVNWAGRSRCPLPSLLRPFLLSW